MIEGPRYIFCGSRYWTNREAIHRELSKLPSNSVIVEGEAHGADSISREEAIKLGYQVLPFKAEWDKYGKAAGPIRNQRMLDEEHPLKVFAFHEDIEHSKGTRDMVSRAKAQGYPVEVFTS